VNLGEFYAANSHVNEVTGCTIWDGEFVRGVPHIPGVGLQVRKIVFESVNGTQPYRTKFEPRCENPNCVKLEHIEAVKPEAQKHDYPEEKVREAFRLYTEEGLRHSKIAEKLGVTESTVSKYIKAAKEQITNDTEAVERGD
jgi:predicted DNA-binding protein (UPF0251 family)